MKIKTLLAMVAVCAMSACSSGVSADEASEQGQTTAIGAVNTYIYAVKDADWDTVCDVIDPATREVLDNKGGCVEMVDEAYHNSDTSQHFAQFHGEERYEEKTSGTLTTVTISQDEGFATIDAIQLDNTWYIMGGYGG